MEEIRKNKEKEELLYNRNQLQYLVDFSPAVIYSSKASGDFGATFISKNIKQQLGYTPEDFLNNSGFWVSNIHPDDSARVFKELNQLFIRDIHSHEYRFKHKNGTYKWMQDSLRLERDEKGNPKQIVGFWIDINKKKETELVSSILNKIAIKYGATNVTEKEFFKYIQKQIGRLINVSSFYISQVTSADTLTFLHIEDEVYKGKIPFNRKLGNGLSEYVIKTGKPLLLRGKEVLKFQKEKGLEIYGTTAKCWLGVPLITSGKSIGVIVCQSYTDKNMYNTAHKKLLTLIANQTSLWFDRKKQEKDLMLSEEKYRNLFQKMSEGLLFSNPKGIVEMINPEFAKLLGYTEKELIGINGYNLLVEKKFQHSVRKKISKRKQGISEQYETQLVKKSGEVIFVHINASPYYDKEGNFIGVMSIIRDITEQKIAEKIKEEFTEQLELKVKERTSELEIYQNELKYQVDTLNQVALVSVTDTDGNITYVNDVFVRLSGYSREELVGKNHRILKSGKQPQEIFKGIWKVISQGKIWKGEIINKAKDGSYYWVNTTIVPFFNVNGEIEKYVSVRFDITEQKQLQEKLKHSLIKEKELGELKSHFVSTASHQFRTPMAIIHSNSELLYMITKNSDQALKPKLEQVTERIQKEIKRMTTLMDDILVFGKIDSGSGIIVNKEATDVLKFCATIAEEFNDIQTDNRKIDVVFFGEPKKVNIDQKLITHAVSNLISNAFKYSTKGNPKIQLTFDKDCLKISVIDSGIGIPENEIKNLFQPFFRAKNVKDIEGTGLGLAITKEYVELNNGKIEVESKLNEGTVFTVIVPFNET